MSKKGIGSFKIQKTKAVKPPTPKSAADGFQSTAENVFSAGKYSTGGIGKKRSKATDTITTRGTKRQGGFKGGARERASLTWDREEYMVSKLKKRDIKEVRKEYSRLRQIAEKRLKRFEGTDWEHAKTYQKNVGKFKKLKDIKDERELRYALIELSEFILNPLSLIKEQQERKAHFIEKMNEKYEGLVTDENYWDFMDFMDAMRQAGIKYMYDSERFLEYFEEKKGKFDIDSLKEEFEAWYEKKDGNFKKWSSPNPSSSQIIREKRKKTKRG